jgi:hypothetical protein
MALNTTRNADCVGFEKCNRAIGDRRLQDESRMNRVFVPLEMSVVFAHGWSGSAVTGLVERAYSFSGIVTARNDRL